jgi:hypothetical protein
MMQKCVRFEDLLVVSMKITIFRVKCSFKVLVPYYQTTRRQISEEHILSLYESEHNDFFFYIEDSVNFFMVYCILN